MDENLQAIGAGIIRHALTTAGGALVAAGILDKGQTGAFVGAGMVLVGIAWSWWQKRGQQQALAEVKRLASVVDFKRKA